MHWLEKISVPFEGTYHHATVSVYIGPMVSQSAKLAYVSYRLRKSSLYDHVSVFNARFYFFFFCPVLICVIPISDTLSVL